MQNKYNIEMLKLKLLIFFPTIYRYWYMQQFVIVLTII